MHVVAFNILGSGHVNPTLPIVRALVARGDQVTYFGYSERREVIEHTGATFRHYGRPNFRVSDYHPEGSFPTQLLPAAAGLMPWLMEQVSSMPVDVVYTDLFAPWGIAVGMTLGVPLLGSCSSPIFGRAGVVSLMKSNGYVPDDANLQALETLKTRWGVTLDREAMGMQVAPVNLVYTTSLFNPPYDDRTERIEFIGPLIEPRVDQDQPLLKRVERSGKRVVYISMGSILGQMLGLGQSFYQPFFDALGSRDDLLVVLSTGRGVDLGAISAPENFIVRDFVPQLALLPYVDAFVTHCGMNSACESLYNGVPMLGLPYHGDQFPIAELLETTGSGLTLDRDKLTADQVGDAIGRLLDEASFRDGASNVQRSFQQAGGVGRALEVFDELANGG